MSLTSSAALGFQKASVHLEVMQLQA
uniref:Uncharacterized protein n=1 Tax=Arundo donax TaxID=35708 RepID=A0A0A9EJU8_ARUDO